MRNHFTPALVVALLGWLPAVKAEPVLANGIVSIVHDSVITRTDTLEMMAPTLNTLQRQYRNQPAVLEQKKADVLKDGVELLVEHQLILHDFETGGYQLPPRLLDDLVEEDIHAKYGDRVKLNKTLQAEGITLEKFRQNIREDFIVRALQSKNVASEVIISPHKLEVYYAEHQDQFKAEDQVKLRMLVLNKPAADDAQARKLADEIRAKIRDGADFSQMASVHSQRAPRQPGGEWWERKELRKELADAAFALKAGETSNVVELADACYLVHVEENKPAHVKPLNEVREEIEKILVTQERNRLQKQWLDKLRRKTFIRYFQ